MEKKMQTTAEIMDIMRTIEEINQILCTVPFNVEKTREKILEINLKHPENYAFYNALHSTLQSDFVNVHNATCVQLQADLQWKQYYLNAKIKGKAFEEIRKELLGRE